MRTLLSFFLVTTMLLCSLVHAEQTTTDDDWIEAENIINQITLPKIADANFNIKDFGAVGDGKHDNRSAIAKAINHAASHGGGKVILPAGIWLTNGPVILKSGINLHISENAALLFGPKAKDYLPVVKQRWEGTEVYAYSPLIYANQVRQ